MNRLALLVGVGLVLSAPGLSARAPAASIPAQAIPAAQFESLRAWLTAARTHQLGAEDEPALTIASWQRSRIYSAIVAALDLAAVIKTANARDAAVGRLQPFMYDRRPFTRAQLLEFLHLSPDDPFVTHPNELLERGAMLHADIAMLVTTPPPQPEDGPGRLAPRSQVPRTILTTDGLVSETQDNSFHWGYAEALIAGVMADPPAEDRVWSDDWYRATSAWQANERRWSATDAHLRRGRALFPSDGRLFFYSGVTHEVFGSPAIQSALDPSAKLGVTLGVGGSSSEIGQAAVFLRQAVDLDPDYAEGHLHLGRVLGELGRHDEAARELERAVSTLADPWQLYYARLFLGYEKGALGDRDAAGADFERAADAYPIAQSPLLGLSQLARHFDDPGAAHAAAERLLALPIDAEPEDDPWWDYMRAHVRNAETLMQQVRRSLSARGPQ